MPRPLHRLFVAAVLLFILGAQARQFDLAVYNAENLFDADGSALYADYQPDYAQPPSPDNARKVLTKIQNITKVLRGFNGGSGPEVILFQELEPDRGPDYERCGDDEVVKEKLSKLKVGRPVRFPGQLGEYQGKPQFVTHQASWLR